MAPPLSAGRIMIESFFESSSSAKRSRCVTLDLILKSEPGGSKKSFSISKSTFLVKARREGLEVQNEISV